MRAIQPFKKKKLYCRFLKNYRPNNRPDDSKAKKKKGTKSLVFSEAFRIQKKDFLFAKNLEVD